MYEIGEMGYVQAFDVDSSCAADDMNSYSTIDKYIDLVAFSAIFGSIGVALCVGIVEADKMAGSRAEIATTIENAYSDGHLTQDEAQSILTLAKEYCLPITASEIVSPFAYADSDLSPVESSLLDSLQANLDK